MLGNEVNGHACLELSVCNLAVTMLNIAAIYVSRHGGFVCNQ
jgi:hypothetical protein